MKSIQIVSLVALVFLSFQGVSQETVKTVSKTKKEIPHEKVKAQPTFKTADNRNKLKAAETKKGVDPTRKKVQPKAMNKK